MALYNIIGINLDGQKDSLGMWVCETESAKYWLSVLNELKNRGVEDVLIFSVDNLKGISEAIEAVFPQAEVQKCIIHQIRNSLRYVSWKERKAMAKDLRYIYEASTEEEGAAALEDFSEKWDQRYPHVSVSWKKNWGEISTFFKYPPEIRKLIYTTNPIESLHRQIKKVAKNKSSFPNEQALIKLAYLAVEGAAKKWTMRHRDWAMIYSQLMIFFEDNGIHFITMEYVSGQDLKGLMRQTGQLTVGKAISIAKQICDGLSEAHGLGVVHRDLKPNSIMIDRGGNAKIMDLCITRAVKGKSITGPGIMIGTPQYMSPEQVEGKEVDQRSDLYSLAIILYEMLTDRVPFEGGTPLTVGVKQKTEIPKDPRDFNERIPDELSRLVLKCL